MKEKATSLQNIRKLAVLMADEENKIYVVYEDELLKEHRFEAKKEWEEAGSPGILKEIIYPV